MLGLYPVAMLRLYVQEQLGITESTYYLHQRYLVQPSTPGPGGRMYYTAEEVNVVIDYWEQYKAKKSKPKAA